MGVTRKLVGKGGRKRKARGVKAATPDQKIGAKKAGMRLNEFKKLSDAKQKRFIKEAKEADKPKKKKKKAKVKRTPAEQAEYNKLIKEYKKDLKESKEGQKDVLPRRRATPPGGVFDIYDQKVEQGDLLSKVLTPKKREMSPETYKRQKRTGQRRRGEYAPPADFIGDEMGMGRRGREMMPTGKELDELISSGFEIKKGGGQVKRRMGGQVRGYGKALRGY